MTALAADEWRVLPVDPAAAAALVVERHYLHRRPPISFAFGLYDGEGGLLGGPGLVGVITFGLPPSRHLQKSVCPTDPDLVVELNRLWVDDAMPRNSESFFVARALRLMPSRLVASYADPKHGHLGYVYRASNFHYAGWTDMDRRTPRYDYLPANPALHTRDAFRNGYATKQRRVAKVRYWRATGNRTERRRLEAICGWPRLDWRELPPPQ